MCKIFAMTNLKNIEVTPELISSIRDAVCRHGDKDGFGYAVMTQAGELFGERSISPFDFSPMTDPVASERVKSLPIIRPTHDVFGVPSQLNGKSLIAHGRMSTNTISIQNTHPFTNGNVALIHNGVVQDSKDSVKSLLKTDCDSEILLRLWERGGMPEIEKHASGYYAIAVLDSKGVLHLAKDDRARLVMAYSQTVDSYLIATTADILSDIAFEQDWEISAIEPLQDNVYAVFNGNSILEHRAITPLGHAQGISSSLADRALGAIPPPAEPYTESDGYSYRDDLETDDSDLHSDDGPESDEYWLRGRHDRRRAR